MYLLTKKKLICIPDKQEEKYKKLKLFFKELLQIDIFRQELKISYHNSIKYHENKQLSNYDPCYLLTYINTNNMYDPHDYFKNQKKQKLIS
jgi:hypothetical protein